MLRLAFLAVFLLLVAVVLVATCGGCGGNGLPAQDGKDIEHATRLAGMSYAHQEAGTAGAATIREAYCDLQKVISDQKLPPIDSGVIQCN